MTILEIYEKVNLVMPLEQRRFFNHFADTADELCRMYGEKFVFDLADGEEYAHPTTLSDETHVFPLYHNAIVDNILFLAGQGEAYQAEFMRKAKDAYLKHWNDNAKGRRIRRPRW